MTANFFFAYLLRSCPDKRLNLTDVLSEPISPRLDVVTRWLNVQSGFVGGAHQATYVAPPPLRHYCELKGLKGCRFKSQLPLYTC